MKPTLLLLAAGMGSRYGGLKQLDGLGPNGETIMDYSIYDAIQAGFGKIVFIIRKDFEEQFREKVLTKYEGHVPVELCFQSLDALPEGFSVPEGRQKPWGTNHAVLMAKDVIKEPFCVINCDDFYNRDCFMAIGKYLSELPEGSKNRDRKSTRLNSSHANISYAVFCLKKKKKLTNIRRSILLYPREKTITRLTYRYSKHPNSDSQYTKILCSYLQINYTSRP